jgi:hypothetical protein
VSEAPEASPSCGVFAFLETSMTVAVLEGQHGVILYIDPARVVMVADHEMDRGDGLAHVFLEGGTSWKVKGDPKKVASLLFADRDDGVRPAFRTQRLDTPPHTEIVA